MKLKNTKYIFGLVPIIISLLLGLVSPLYAYSDNSKITPASVTAEVYAKHYSVSIEEALHRLTLQDSFPGLPTALENGEKGTFGGIWIQHEPEYRIVVAFTENGQQSLDKYSKLITKEVSAYIETKVVKTSFVELRNEQNKISQYLADNDVKIISRVDVINNCVSIDILKADKDKFTIATQNDTSTMTEGIEINFIDSLPVPSADIYGGLLLLSPIIPPVYNGGTSGFAVKTIATGTKGIITCAHTSTPLGSPVIFVDNSNIWHNLAYQTGSYGGSYDWQWCTCPGLNVTNKIQWWDNGWTFDVNAKKTYLEQVIGDVVCKYGRTTHYTCGQITSTTTPLPSPQNAATYIEVTNIFGYPKLADHGDSGGPWFYCPPNSNGVTALGITSAITSDGVKSFYMAQDFIEPWGISVMTSP
jgi:hypothetical protein